VFRERRRFVDAVFPDARWVSIVRLGFDASPITVYRWANRVASEGNALIRNMDSIEYFAPNGTRIGAASAARRYRGVIVDGRYGDARGRVGVWGSWTFAQNEGTVDDTFAENISRSGRFESPSASLVNVDGRATTTSAHKLSVLATALIPWIGARVSAVYVGRSGRRYAATRQFGNETLDFPQSEDGRQVLLETRGARELPFDHELDLRGEYALRFGRHSIGLYVDVINLVNDATVLDVESLYPLASAGGSGIVRFEAPTRVRSPRQLYVGGCWGF
jgi:hypothetical protein